MSGGGGIYGLGRAFNLKYRPNGPLKTFIYDRRMPLFGFGPRRPHYGGGFDLMSTNVTYEYNRGFWGNLADIFTGLAAGFGIFTQIRGMFSSNSDIVQGPEGKPKPQGAKSDDDAANLKRLETFAKQKDITVVSEGNGKFTLMAKDGQNIKDATYKDAQDWIFDYNKKTEAKTPTEKAKETKEPESTGKGTEGASESEGAGASGGAGGAGAAGGAGGSRRKTNQKDPVAPADPTVPTAPVEKTIDKTKPVTKVIKAWVSDKSGKGNASVTMPDGQTFYAETGWSGDKKHAYDDLLRQLQNKLRDAGWKNVTLKLPHNAQIDDKTNVADEKTTNDDNKAQAADKKNADAADKTKTYDCNGVKKSKAEWDGTLTIKFKLDSYGGGIGSYGLGSVTTPDGKKHVAETGRSLTESRAKIDIRNQLLKEIRADGWKKAQIEVVV